MGFQLAPLAGLILKIGITAGCFWYISSQLNFIDLVQAGKTLHLGWVVLATLAISVQIPLVALRWVTIVDALRPKMSQISYAPMLAITAICGFFGQVLPNVVGDTMRVALLNRLRPGWRRALTSVVIDRAIGIGTLFVLGCFILAIPSQFADLIGYRYIFLSIFGAAVIAGLLVLALSPLIVSILDRWPLMSWISRFMEAAHSVFFHSSAGLKVFGLAIIVHAFSILAVWLLALGLGLTLPPSGAAVLFTIMVAISLVPISIGGWGVRELAVTTFLQFHDIPAERALIFSVCFGLVLLLATVPGAIVWIFSPHLRRSK